MNFFKCFGSFFLVTLVDSTIIFAEDKPEMTPGKIAVMEQIRSLMIDKESNNTESISLTEDTPYLQIVKGRDGFSSLIYRCRNVKSKNIIDSLENIVSKAGLVEESKDENMLVVRDKDEKIEEIRQVILALDVTVPQILVEAKVIEVYTQGNQEKSLEWDLNQGIPLSGVSEGSVKFPATGSQPDVFSFTPFSAGISGNFNRLHLFLNWLNTVNDAKVLSSPNLTVSLNSTGSIVTGEDLPIQSTSTTGSTVNTDIKYKRTGIQLEVTPVRINSNTVKLQVSPEVSTVTRYENFNETRTPVVSIRNVKTELTVRDGEIIMLGGLYSSEELKTVKKVPFLGDIPLFGWFFTSYDNSTVLKQLIFLVKVNIISSGKETFVDIEKQAENLKKTGKLLHESKKLFPQEGILTPEERALKISNQKTDEENKAQDLSSQNITK